MKPYSHHNSTLRLVDIYKNPVRKVLSKHLYRRRALRSVCMVMILRFFLFVRCVGFVLIVVTFRRRNHTGFYCSRALRYAIKRGHSVRAQKSHPRSGEQSYPIDLLRWRAREGYGGSMRVTRVVRVGAASARRNVQPHLHLPCRNHDTLATSRRTTYVTLGVGTLPTTSPHDVRSSRDTFY